MRRRWPAAIAAVMTLGLGCGPHPDEHLQNLLPDESILEGWTVADGPTAYRPEDLYDYLNGGAERYLSYGFERLLHVRYQVEGDDESGIDLDLYDMGSELGAFGIYSVGHRRDSPPRDWGTAGVYFEAARVWKGRVFVHGASDYENERANAALNRIMASVTGRIAGDIVRPAALQPLPTEGLVPRSEQYVAKDLLGHAFLPGGVVAAYRLEGFEARLFFSDLGSGAAAADAVRRLHDHWARWIDVSEIPSPGDGGFHYSDAEDGTGTVVRAGSFVAGIRCDLEGLSLEAQRELLNQLGDRLNAASADSSR